MFVFHSLPQEEVTSIINTCIACVSNEATNMLNSIFRQFIKSNSHPDMIKLLLQDPRVDPSLNNNSAIDLAIKNNNIENVKLLLSDSRISLITSSNAIQFAIMRGHLEVVKLLLADTKVAFDNKYLFWAAKSFQIEIVKLLLLDPRVNPSSDSNYLIRELCMYQYTSDPLVQIIKLLLQDPRVDPSFDNNILIRSMGSDTQIDVVKLLLQDPRIDPTANDNYAIRNASKYGQKKIVE